MNMRKGENDKRFTERKKSYKAPSVKIIPLGGLDQIGMNITAIE